MNEKMNEWVSELRRNINTRTYQTEITIVSKAYCKAGHDSCLGLGSGEGSHHSITNKCDLLCLNCPSKHYI